MPTALVTLLAAPTAASPRPVAAAGESVAVPWWVFALVAAVVLLAGAALLRFALQKGAAVEERCGSCGKVMLPTWTECMFCKTARRGGEAALEVVSGPRSGHTIALGGEVTTIGSAPGSTVELSDSGVSRKHAGIRKSGGGYELADLGSTNGVYVNGEKVARKTLRLGDVIRVGATEMVFKG